VSAPEEILDFWFGREGEEGYGEFREAWFTKDPEFDREIRDRFETVYKEAASGELDSWKEEVQSCLALIIVLDQFPHNMIHGDARMYATDEKALAATWYAVEHAFDQELPLFQRGFVYMPFNGSAQRESGRPAPLGGALPWDRRGGGHHGRHTVRRATHGDN
jgi:uncharacterized protein (DUF924 family)